MLRSALLLLLAGLLLGGCASVPKDYPRTETSAFQDHQRTAIGRFVAEAAALHPGQSGFTLIRYGRNAFTARAALSELAEKTLALQDYTGNQTRPGASSPNTCCAPPTAGCGCCSTTSASRVVTR